MTIKACIFDLDGVIVDTAKYHFLAWKELADSLSIPFDEEDNEKLKGVSRMDSLDIILALGNIELSLEEKKALAEKKNNRYKSFLSDMDENEMLPGAKDLLINLKNSKVKIALGSASKNAPTILEYLGITELFDVIVDGNHVTKAKPDPEVFKLGADQLNVSYDECIVFEDSIAGLEAAKSINMHTIGIGNESNLSKADYVFADLSSLNYKKLCQLF